MYVSKLRTGPAPLIFSTRVAWRINRSRVSGLTLYGSGANNRGAAGVEKLVDSGVSKAPSREGVPVRVRPPAPTRGSRTRAAVLVLIVAALTASCQSRSKEREPKERRITDSLPGADVRSPVRSQGTQAKRIDVVFEPTSRLLSRDLRTRLMKWPLFGDLVGRVANYRVDETITVKFLDCRDANAYYDPNTLEVLVCYELFDHLVDLFDPYVDRASSVDEMVLGVVAFIMLHEVGHAIVDVLDIPITGREEDAVDQLATWLLLTSGPLGEEVALDAASWFALVGDEEGEEGVFWGEHSLDHQRFYSLACWVYGASPERNDFLVAEKHLPPERAKLCGDEYARFSHSWDVLLAPHRVVGTAPDSAAGR